MSKGMITLATAFLFFVFSAGMGPAMAQDKQVVDQIAAVVGDNIVLKSDVDRMVQQVRQQQNAAYSDELWMQMLERLIDQQILVEQAQRDTTIQITDETVDQYMDRWIEQSGGEERVEGSFGKNILEVREDLSGDFRDQLLADRLRNRKLSEIDVTPSEVRQWFQAQPQDSLPRQPESVRLAHIVRYPAVRERARREARSIIETIRDSIVNKGAEFESMAQQFSDDSGSAQQGGRIDGLPLDAFVADFAAVASRTPVGEVSRVFYNPQHKGFHILRINDRRGDVVDLNHILIRIDQTQSDASPAIEYLRAVRDTLVENPDVPFELMAKRHSEEEQSSRNGGRVTDPQTGIRDLALQRLGPSWKRTINEIEVGEISQPREVTLLNGDQAFHIVLLQDRKPPHRLNLQQDYELVRQAALRNKQQRVLSEWLDDLREDVFVDVRIEPEDLTAMR
jgi:peptidyl-prolyl cis-trans isomerase SurA